jgi:hypothetical protein
MSISNADLKLLEQTPPPPPHELPHRTAIMEFVASLSRAVSRYTEMLSAAWVLKKGYCPVIVRSRDQLRAWLVDPSLVKQAHTKERLEELIGAAQLELLATRFKQQCEFEPDETMVEVVYDELHVTVRFAKLPDAEARAALTR